MREVFSDFFTRQQRPDGSVRIPLGAETPHTPDLTGLHDGERVLLLMPGELQAEAIVESERHQGKTFWYGVLASMDAIENIYDPAPTPSETHA